MNGTPRLRSAFPQTPRTSPVKSREAPVSSSITTTTLKSLPKSSQSSSPLISFDVIDAPSQRLYIALFYGLLHAWRFYDYYNIVADDTESFWAFLKWSAFDAVFLFGLPVFQIPWLEWSGMTTSLLWGSHLLLNLMLMFRIGIPIHLWLAGVVKALHDDELGLMGRSVKPGDIIQNASLILGKQIINILPEGSAILNPTEEAFCLGGSITSAQIPIQINQTNPIRMEILYVDLDNTKQEVMTLSAKDIKKLRKQADRDQRTIDAKSPVLLKYTAKRTGMYILQRVIDETDLDVQTSLSSLLIVACPKARIAQIPENRCKGEASDVLLEVEGTPPLKVTYHRYINGEEHSSTFQSIQPDDFVSPYGVHQKSSAMVLSGDTDLTYARSYLTTVPLSETLHNSGTWSYSIDQVQDALGNFVSYKPLDSEETTNPRTSSTLYRSFAVHERPRVHLEGCNYQKPLKVPKGQARPLPLAFTSTGKGSISGTSHTVEYMFTAEDDLTSAGEHGSSAVRRKQTLKTAQDTIQVQENGLYTLQTVSTEYCAGEVLEPASCLLQNPPRPEVSVTTEDIFDKCAGNPIGLRADLDLIGTPPFQIRYIMDKAGGPSSTKTTSINGLRGQIVLEPINEGQYTYKFIDISDAVYKNVPLRDEITQHVKPAAWAEFTYPIPAMEACLDEPVSYKVYLRGEAPWTLEYELVHGGKRNKRKADNIETDEFIIRTDPLKSGGDYSLVLTGITDRTGCKEFLEATAKFKVRNEKPKGYFGNIEGQRKVQILEGKKVQLPLRLTGKAPWTATYKNLEEPEKTFTTSFRRENDLLEVSRQGTYELATLNDAVCPGAVDESAKQFQIGWIPRPTMSILENVSLKSEGSDYVKAAICEGDEDSFDVLITGTAPYEVSYSEEITSDRGQKLMRGTKNINAALGVANVKVDSTQAGLYKYKFNKLSDANYASAKGVLAAVQQRVHPRPDVEFVHPGKTYSYCSKEEDGEEIIPIKLVGIPPFTIEVEVKHLSGRSRNPERVTVPNVSNNIHELRIPHRLLQHGISHVFVRKVRDSRGCQRRLGLDAKKVAISVHDAPAITSVESRTDFCVGDRLSYTLSGTPPFTVYTSFNKRAHQATSPDTTFRRLAEAPGSFAITAISDNASSCRASTQLNAQIHAMPTVRISQGRVTSVNLREGGETEIQFDFTGVPPFEVTYTRSSLARSGHKPRVLETRVERTSDFSIKVKASEEGQYEAIAIKDRWCAFPRPGEGSYGGRKGQMLLQN